MQSWRHKDCDHTAGSCQRHSPLKQVHHQRHTQLLKRSHKGEQERSGESYSQVLPTPHLPQLIQSRRKALAHQLPPHAPIRRGGDSTGSERVATPLGVDGIEHAHDALRGGGLGFGEEVVGVFAALAEVHQQYFGFAEGEALSIDKLQPGNGRAGDVAGVVGGVWQFADDAFGEPGFVRVEHTGADADAYALAQRLLGSQLFTGARGVGGDGFANGGEFAQAVAEHA